MPLLEVNHLSVAYQTRKGLVTAVEDISFELDHGSTLGFVGESGSGKSTLGMALMRLLPKNASILQGHLYFDNQDLLALTEEDMRHVRWKKMSMIFQAAMNALNPVHRVADQIMEAIATHNPNLADSDLWKQVNDLFDLVHIPRERIREYPHQYSGGMKQRAIIAMALACRPSLIIADEPTTALDVILQHRILEQIKALQRQLNLAVLFISHDISVVADVCHHIGVMYAGRLIEFGSRDKIIESPTHPYTRLLIASYRALTGDPRPEELYNGMTTEPGRQPDVCAFLKHCPDAEEHCAQQKPVWVDVSPDHRVFCLRATQTGGK